MFFLEITYNIYRNNKKQNKYGRDIVAKKLTILLMHEPDVERDVYEWKVHQNIGTKTSVDSFNKKQDALKFIAGLKKDYSLFAFSNIGKLTYVFHYDPRYQEYSVEVETILYKNDKEIKSELKLLPLFSEQKTENLKLIEGDIEVPEAVSKIIAESKEELRKQIKEAERTNKDAFAHRRKIEKEKEATQLISRTLLKKAEEIQKDISEEEQKTIEFKLKYESKINKKKSKQKRVFEKARHDALSEREAQVAQEKIRLNKAESKERYALEKQRFDRLIKRLRAVDAEERAKLTSEYDELKAIEQDKAKQQIAKLEEADVAKQDKVILELTKVQEVADKEKFVIDKDLREIQKVQDVELKDVQSSLEAKLWEVKAKNEEEIRLAIEEKDHFAATLEEQKVEVTEAFKKDKEMQEVKILDNTVLAQEKILSAREKLQDEKVKLDALVENAQARYTNEKFELEKALLSNREIIKQSNRDLRLLKKENRKHVFGQFITSRFNTVELELRFSDKLKQWIVAPLEKYVYYNKFEIPYKSKEKALVDINNYTFSSNITVYNKEGAPAYVIKKDFINNYQTLKLLEGATDSIETIKEATIVKPRILEPKRKVGGVPITLDNTSLVSRKMTYWIIAFIFLLAATMLAIIVI